MWKQHKKALMIALVVLVNTIILFCVLGDIHKKDEVLNQENFNYEKSLYRITGNIILGEQELVLQGYCSDENDQWYIALPAGFDQKEVYMKAYTKEGTKVFKRSAEEERILLTIGDDKYLINFLCEENIDTLYVELSKDKKLADVHENKTEEFPGRMMILGQDGHVEAATIRGFYGHGNDSWEADKKSYNLKFSSSVDLLGMGENNDFALLAGYRFNSLMSYCTSAEFVQEMEFDYAPEYRLVNLYVAGEYVGVYFLTEKIELDKNRIDISNIYEETKKVNSERLNQFQYQMYLNEITEKKGYYYDIPVNPKDITGGYLLELDVADYDENVSRFITKGRKNKVTLKRARYASEAEVKYIADFWQDFEDALLSEDGMNLKGKKFTEYIDLESFAMQWLLYELAQENSMRSSIYYYKESNVTGDGLLHACYPWDLERSYTGMESMEKFWNVEQGEFWEAFYRHEESKRAIIKVWNEKLSPAIDLMIRNEAIETEAGFRNLSWFQKNCFFASELEHARWNETNFYEKCENIRKNLKCRQDVLTSIFAI